MKRVFQLMNSKESKQHLEKYIQLTGNLAQQIKEYTALNKWLILQIWRQIHMTFSKTILVLWNM